MSLATRPNEAAIYCGARGGGRSPWRRTYRGLHVTAVLDGSVRRAGPRIRVSAERTNTADSRVLWSETYERAPPLSLTPGMPRRMRSWPPPSSFSTITLRSTCHEVLGRGRAAAERELRLAIAIDPQSAEAHYRLAELLIYVGRVREALTSLEEVQRLDPLYGTSVNNRAWMLAMLDRQEEAATEITRALSLDPRNVVSNDIALRVLACADRRDELAAHARAVPAQTTDALSMGRAAWGLARGSAR